MLHTFNDKRGEMKFINTKDTEQFMSVNKKNVFRGIHCSPYGKTVTCLRGRIVDFIINLEDESNPQIKKVYLCENQQLYIPPNHGHGFFTLDDDTIILYQLDGKFNPDFEKNYHYADPIFGLDLPVDVIVSDKDEVNPFLKPIEYAVLGAKGFLGNETCNILKNQNKSFVALSSRLEEVDKLWNELVLYKPKYVICAAGISGKPTTAWCDDHQVETLHTNLTLQLGLCHMCDDMNIHLTIYGSGLVFENDNGMYTENSKPNLTSKYYSKIRGLLENAVSCYKNVLYLRILYPVSGNGHEKCFLSKMIGREADNRSVCMTIIPDLFPHVPSLIEREITGVLNFTNPGSISLHNFQKICTESDRKPQNELKPIEMSFTLVTNRLKELCPSVLNIETALKTYIHRTIR